MKYEIIALTSDSEIETCALLMVTSNPWDKLFFTKDQCKASLSQPEVILHGAMSSEGTIYGFLASIAHGVGNEPLIEYLCVDERFRRLRIGTTLIRYFEEVLFPTSDNLFLFVSDINPQAARLYVKLGYLQVGALPNFNLEMQTEFLHRKTRRPRQAGHMLAHGRSD